MDVALFRGFEKSLAKTFRVLGRSRYFRSKYRNPPGHNHKCSDQGSRSTKCAPAAVPGRRHRLGTRQEHFLHSRRTLRPVRCSTSIRRRASLGPQIARVCRWYRDMLSGAEMCWGGKSGPSSGRAISRGSKVVHPAAPALNWDHVCYASGYG